MAEPVEAQAEQAATPEVETTDQNVLTEEKSQQHAESGGDTVAAAVEHGDISTAAAAAQQPSAENVHLAEEPSNTMTSELSSQPEHQQAVESAPQHEQQEAVQSAEQEHTQHEAPAAADALVETPEAQQQDHPTQQQVAEQAAVHGAEMNAEGAAPDEPHASAAEADHPKVGSSRSSSSGGAEAPAKPAQSPKKSVHSADAGAKPAAPEAPQHAAEHPAAVDSPSKSSKGQHKETAVERLTTPTAMRMLKTLEQTQGGKDEWHIATGVPFKSKKLSTDEMSAMVDRLCTPKHESDNLPPKPHAVKLVFEGNKEVLVPVKETSKNDNIAYMENLYERCQETRAKTKQTLQEKWLKPLIQPKQASTAAK